MVAKPKEGYKANGSTFKVHADGYNFMPFLKGEAPKGPREEIYYFTANGELNAVRYNDWKVHFAVQNGNIATAVRDVPGWPVIINLRADPYEKAPHESAMYMRWYADNIWLFVPIGGKIQQFLSTIPGFPFQEGAGMNPSNVNYMTLKAAGALKALESIQNQGLPAR